MKKKTLAIILAVVVLVSVITTGTIAWLTAKTPSITNTFAPSNIGLVLSESDNLNLKMVPGKAIPKDPVVTVTANSEACYVFVKIDENLGAWASEGKTFGDYLSYQVITGNDDWLVLDNTNYPGVYYRKVVASTADQPFPVLQGNQVVVSDTVTKQMMSALTLDNPSTTDVNESTCPTLTFTAYAIQSEGFADAAAAWAEAKNAPASNGN